MSTVTTNTEQLITDAKERLTARRIGGSIMRETDKDILVIRRLVERLEADTAAEQLRAPRGDEMWVSVYEDGRIADGIWDNAHDAEMFIGNAHSIERVRVVRGESQNEPSTLQVLRFIALVKMLRHDLEQPDATGVVLMPPYLIHRLDEALAVVGAQDVPAKNPHPSAEREALIDALLDELGWEWDEVPEEHIPSSREILGDLANRVLAVTDGFRHTEVPAPSAEEWAARVQAARGKAIARGYTPEHDAKHGVRHLLRWAIDYARRGKAEDSSGLISAAMDLADVAYAELERLRHVADTMKAVSEALRTRYASDSQAAYFMRQIDTALEALPEPLGEPSDAQVEAAARSWVMNGGVATWDNAAPHVRDNAIRRMREALRAAGGVR